MENLTKVVKPEHTETVDKILHLIYPSLYTHGESMNLHVVSTDDKYILHFTCDDFVLCKLEEIKLLLKGCVGIKHGDDDDLPNKKYVSIRVKLTHLNRLEDILTFFKIQK